ncbi:MAG: hypothetical protein QOI38_2588 [Sphingomonadales bacterium]|jgi:hypothetical protein|nr:hypothetical protein [Sphingomonadales bacterium]
MRRLFRTSRGRREGAVDGLNLFFGALLGANLGTLDGLRLVSYVQLVTLLAGTVMALRVVSLSERLGRALVVLALYAAMLVMLATVPAFHPAGMALGDLHKLVATLALWVTFVVVIEIVTRKTAAEPDAG